jgi:hypothetical protein
MKCPIAEVCEERMTCGLIENCFFCTIFNSVRNAIKSTGSDIMEEIQFVSDDTVPIQRDTNRGDQS